MFGPAQVPDRAEGCERAAMSVKPITFKLRNAIRGMLKDKESAKGIVEQLREPDVKTGEYWVVAVEDVEALMAPKEVRHLATLGMPSWPRGRRFSPDHAAS